MYTPKDAHNLSTAIYRQIIFGLQGEPGSGKTFSALTFPNPVVLDFDNGLVAHKGRDIIVVPFHDSNFCIEKLGLKYQEAYVAQRSVRVLNKRDALLIWLTTEGIQLTEEQTLIVDSWTSVQDAFDKQTEIEPVRNREGKIDEFAFWERKIDYARDLLEALTSLRCHVVVTFHESWERDKNTGKMLDRYQPLMQGKFVTKLKNYFTDFFRQVVIERREPAAADGTPGNYIGADYFWQIKSDDKFLAKTRMTRNELLISATYNSFTY